jgi:hypothetical protein
MQATACSTCTCEAAACTAAPRTRQPQSRCPHLQADPQRCLPSTQRLRELDINIIEEDADKKDYSVIDSGDVVIFPAFGATVQEMQLFRDKEVQMVDTTCPWVSKVSHRRSSCTAVAVRDSGAGHMLALRSERSQRSRLLHAASKA